MNKPTRTIATFQTDKFNTKEEREYFINPQNYGDDLARWLASELQGKGAECDKEPGQEDFGWYLNFKIDGGLYCAVLLYRPDDENDSGTWICCLERSVGFLASIFGGRDKDISIEPARRIHDVLSACPEIRHIRWHLRKDFDKGKEENGSSSPD